jgi:hypothetical protein
MGAEASEISIKMFQHRERAVDFLMANARFS